jgi:hypothetical protein
MISNLEYLTNSEGKPTAIVIPIELWQQLLPNENASLETISEAIEDYCLSKAMDQGKASRLLTKTEALKYLED